MAHEFEQTYRAHVGKVAAGDLRGALADMDPAVVPAVFEGVDVPGGDVTGVEVVGVSVEGDRATGEAVYATPGGPIGLRSAWRRQDGGWLADGLENFPVDA